MTYKVQIDDEIRNATPDEIVIIQNGHADTAAKIAAIEAVAAAKVSARAKLKSLGLTDNEIAALVG
jgi:S-adenosylhomocysteine hydrolase